MGFTTANAIIENVTVGFDDRHRLCTTLNLKSTNGSCCWRFLFENPADVQRLSQLMRYLGVYYVDALTGRVIRVISYNGSLKGIGHTIFDKFFPLSTKDFKELSEAQLKQLLRT